MVAREIGRLERMAEGINTWLFKKVEEVTSMGPLKESRERISPREEP